MTVDPGIYRSQALRQGDLAPPLLTCPWCSRRAMTRKRRAALAPGARTHCDSCRTPIRIPPRRWIVLVPFVVANVLLAMLGIVSLSTMLRPLAIEWWYVGTVSACILTAGWNATTRLAMRTPLVR